MDPGLDGLGPATHPAGDASHFRRIVAARKRLAEAEAELRDAVVGAREAGDSWTVIAAALEISSQAARERFGNRINAKDYVISAEAIVSDIDLDTEEFIYQGKRLTEADAERLVEKVLRMREGEDDERCE